MAEQNCIVFPTDFSDMSMAALPWARKMTEMLGGELHCIAVVQQPIVLAPLMAGTGAGLPTIEELSADAQYRLDKFVTDRLGELPKPTVGKVVIGRPADEIVAYASKVDAKMIVMSTHGYSGLQHMLIGSTAEAVVRHASCPVLTVRSS